MVISNHKNRLDILACRFGTVISGFEAFDGLCEGGLPQQFQEVKWVDCMVLEMSSKPKGAMIALH